MYGNAGNTRRNPCTCPECCLGQRVRDSKQILRRIDAFCTHTAEAMHTQMKYESTHPDKKDRGKEGKQLVYSV